MARSISTGRGGIWFIEGGHVAHHHNGAWGAPTLDVNLTKRMSSPEQYRRVRRELLSAFDKR